uniref:U3 small nucleolar RNA-associated protein 15 homolog n=1 Tax=Denticeps clupeoides TaxID=299321 RepID=A0AAY4BTZ5_9TELE
MTAFKPTRVPVIPQLGEKVTEDALYWRSYKSPVQIKEFGAVTKIHFSPLSPHNYAVTASTRVQIFGPNSHEPLRSFSRFKGSAYSGSFRADGRLLVAGSDEGLVRLFDVGGRVALRQFTGHSKSVRVTSFLSDGFRIVSGSDDLSSRVWDVSTAQEVAALGEHSDYIRALATSSRNPDVFITGSYDHTLRVWDARLERCVMKMEHGQPVEGVLLYPSEGLLVSTGGQHVKVWDLLKGGQQLVSLKNHHKTVTCVCLSTHSNRLLTGSLDRHVKVYSSSYKVVHTFDYEASVLSLAVAPDDGIVAVGMTNGVLSLRHRKPSEEQEVDGRKRRGPSYRMFVKGRNYTPKQDDFVVRKSLKHHLKKHDRLLKSFKVSEALDSALEVGPAAQRSTVNTPEVCVAVLIELERRGTLRNAVAGREEESITPLLNFLLRFITDPRFSRILLSVAHVVVDVYQQVVSQSPVMERLLQRLLECLGREIDYQQELLQVLGILDTLFASATLTCSTSEGVCVPCFTGVCVCVCVRV